MTFSEARQKSRIKLTPEEMREISQEINLRFAPSKVSLVAEDIFLEREDVRAYSRRSSGNLTASLKEPWQAAKGLTAKELYEISREISLRFPPKEEIAKPELFLLPVDPYHLYAYWNIGPNNGQTRSQASVGNDLILRIYWLPHGSSGDSRSNVWFDVPIRELNARQKVRLPLDDAAYSAALGKLLPNHGFDVYACSNPIRVPRGHSKIISVPDQDERSGQEGNAIRLPAARKGSLPVPSHTNEESFAASGLMDLLLATQEPERQPIGKGWYAKLHFLHPVDRNRYPLKLIARFIDLIKERDIGIQLIPEPALVEDTHFPWKNASGLGIKESI